MSGWSNLGLGKIRLGQVWDWVGLSLGLGWVEFGGDG